MNSEQVARYAGISYRQLDMWLRRGWIPNALELPGIGRARKYSEENLAFLRRMGALVRAGIYPDRAHKVAAGEEKSISGLVAALQPCVVQGELVYRPVVGRVDPPSAEPCG